MTNHIVEIQVVRVMGTVDDTKFNDVGIVVPAKLSNLQNEDTVAFHYHVDQSGGSDETIEIKFSMPWFDPTVQTMVLKRGIPETRLVTQVISDHEIKIWYRAFCNSIGEKAVGNSPPEMTLGP